MSFETLNPHLESQIERIVADKAHASKLSIIGSSSLLSIAYFIAFSSSRRLNQQPHLFVLPKESDCSKLANAIEFFDPTKKVYILTEFDVSPYSGLYPSPHVLRDRLHFLSRAQNAKPGDIFIASFLGLQQKTMPVDVLIETTQLFKIGDSLPENLSTYLSDLGYESAPMVEDVGQFAIRGGIVDIFSPGEKKPVRVELFGNQIETLRFFSTESLKSESEIKSFLLTPAKETLYVDNEYENIVPRFRKTTTGRDLRHEEIDDLSRSLVQKSYFPGIEFLISSFYEKPSLPVEHFSAKPWVWFVDPLETHRISDDAVEELKSDFRNSTKTLIRPALEDFFSDAWLAGGVSQELNLDLGFETREFYFSNIDFNSSAMFSGETANSRLDYRSFTVQEFSNLSIASTVGSEAWTLALQNKLSQWKRDHYRIFVSLRNATQAERLKNYIENMDFEFRRIAADDYKWDTYLSEQNQNPKIIHFLQRPCFESLRIEDEKIIFLREEDFFGKKSRASTLSSSDEFQKQAKRLNFGDLKPGDLVVHIKHGIGQYEGLKVMPVNGIDSEFIQLSYKEKDKLYLPVYRVGQLQKYSGAADAIPLDKLGGTSWEKTKIKVKSHLKDIASELLALYAKRAEIQRPAFLLNDEKIQKFEFGFPYEETEDQQRSIDDIYKDMKSTKPMDRLVCGDVGFGKTEVAMRAVFFAIESKKQVALLAPTTVLSFQHFENFKKRFKDWPEVRIRELNRFVSNTDAKKTLVELKEGKVDIIIGTHRLFSKDVVFKDLGLLVVDEEQKFGVLHKEKIKKLKATVDTLTLSATPIPRTLNMSLVGIRDLSLINTAPVDRLPTRTFICKWEEETIRKAIESEVHRGGQIYFVHNRVQTIYGIADELRALLPNVRMKVAHGQMPEDELEKTMLAFFNHEIDMLISTAIVESGMDVSRANTMFIDQAHMFGLSQLYQLRGRVGRSKQRAYCYLLLPRARQLDKDAQERLKIIQENTQLGSGIKIAQYDLELRGSGNILGDEQSGHVNTVGYELYMDLLNEALATARGEDPEDDLDPEINLRIPAMIPDKYIPDIRMRLSYYKALAEIKFEEDVEKIEEELKDQFGALPEPVVNLIGVMLVRKLCKDLGVRDVSAGLNKVSLIFSDKTKLAPQDAIKLAAREPKKYSIMPDSRLNIRMEVINWSAVYEELKYLLAVSDGNDPKDPSAKVQNRNKSLIRRMGIFN
jgi:transcription-repair coupling factor (superfamily II helicase)